MRGIAILLAGANLLTWGCAPQWGYLSKVEEPSVFEKLEESKRNERPVDTRKLFDILDRRLP